MPLSASFRREMIEAVKNAKKKNDSHDNDEIIPGTPTPTLIDDNSSKMFGQGSAGLAKPLTSSRSVHIKDDQAKLEKALEKTQSTH